MQQPLKIMLLGATLVLVGCAPSQFHADAGPLFVRPRGHVALQNTAGTLELDHAQDLHDNLGVANTRVSPYLRFDADWGPQRVRVHGFGYTKESGGTLGPDFGDIPGGTQVTTSMDYLNVGASWSYDLFPGETFRFAPGVQLAYYSLSLSTHSIAPVAFEKVETDVLVPELYFEGEVNLGLASLVTDLGFMSAHLRDAGGNYFDLESMLRVHPASEFEIFGGYRYILMDARGTATGRDFDADIAMSGWFFGAGVRF